MKNIIMDSSQNDSYTMIQVQKHNALRENKKSDLKCKHCGKTFTSKTHFNQHTSTHMNKNTKTTYVCAFADCTFSSKDKKSINFHLSTSHGCDLAPQKIAFDSIEEFNVWKDNLCRANHAQYTAIRRTRFTSSIVSADYACHRNGFYVAKGRNLRRLKASGSNRIDGYCPSSMKVHEMPDGRVNVAYIETHTGHEMERKRLRASKGERDNKIKFDRNRTHQSDVYIASDDLETALEVECVSEAAAESDENNIKMMEPDRIDPERWSSFFEKLKRVVETEEKFKILNEILDKWEEELIEPCGHTNFNGPDKTIEPLYKKARHKERA